MKASLLNLRALLQRDGEDLQGVQFSAAEQAACAEEGCIQQLPWRAEFR